MADPVVVKVSALNEATDLATDDLLTVVDISEAVVSNKTKKLQVGNLKLFNANQLRANVVSTAAIANNQVTLAKMAANSIDSDQYVDGSIDLVHLSALVAARLEAIKVNGLYFSTESTNPATSLGYGTWVAYAAGRIPIGVGTSDAVYAAGATGGATMHTNTVAEMATHTHVQNGHNHTIPQGVAVGGSGSSFATYDSNVGTYTSSTVATNQNAGNGTPYNNMPPYIAVYIWRRTA